MIINAYGSNKMKSKVTISLLVIALALAFSLSGFFTKNRGTLNKLPANKEKELRQNWKNYTVYKTSRGRDTIAILFKVKNDKEILLPRDWVEIRTEAEMAESKIWQAAHSAELVGQNGVLFGYLIYRSIDKVSTLISDENTIRIFYHSIKTSKD